jgi:trk system potassium uptake protein TrkH
VTGLARWVVWTSALALVAVLLGEGWEVSTSAAFEAGMWVVGFGAVLLSVAYDVALLLRRPRRLRELRGVGVDMVLLVPVAVFVGQPSLWGLSVFLRQSLVFGRLVAQTARYRRFVGTLQSNPAKVMVLSFAGIIALGGVLLTFPRATTDGAGAGVVDALFTSTSATCVTGLATLNTVADQFADLARQSFSPFGQVVILMLAQIGGLGIMTISAATVVLAGGRLGLRRAGMMQSLLDEESTATLRAAVRQILVMTFTIETIGAVLLFLRFDGPDVDSGTALWQAVFTSISAFCNAGFSIFGDSLSSYVGDTYLNAVVSGLIIAGGLGFTTIVVLAARRTWRGGPGGAWRRIPLQTRLVVTTSLTLIVLGTVTWFYFEYEDSLAGLSVHDKVVASFFQSVSLRTAGFNTVDIGEISRVTLIISCVLMFIGASPGSTGGGVKTTTVAVLLMSIRASIRSQASIEVGRRSISPVVVNRAVSIVVIALLVLILGLVLLLVTQPELPFDQLLFEVVSALGTVGLSMGATPHLDDVGKIIVIIIMFIGRVGPLTVALAVGRRQAAGRIHYPEGRVVVG